jgi:hypothetical protein
MSGEAGCYKSDLQTGRLTWSMTDQRWLKMPKAFAYFNWQSHKSEFLLIHSHLNNGNVVLGMGNNLII